MERHEIDSSGLRHAENAAERARPRAQQRTPGWWARKIAVPRNIWGIAAPEDGRAPWQ